MLLFQILFLLLYLEQSQGKICEVGSEKNENGQWMWVLAVDDPCRCTQIVLGGRNMWPPIRSFEPIYTKTPLISSHIEKIRDHYGLEYCDDRDITGNTESSITSAPPDVTSGKPDNAESTTPSATPDFTSDVGTTIAPPNITSEDNNSGRVDSGSTEGGKSTTFTTARRYTESTAADVSIADDDVCNGTTNASTNLVITWQPAGPPASRLDFKVKTPGVARIVIANISTEDTNVTVFIGVGEMVKYREECMCERGEFGQDGYGTSKPLLISCTHESGVIDIQSALYGRRVTGDILCLFDTKQGTSTTNCNTTEAADTEKVKTLCNGESYCSVPVNNGIFGDPCDGTYKYLRVTYTCNENDIMAYSAKPGNDIKAYIQHAEGFEEVSFENTGHLSAVNFTAMYLQTNEIGLHVGFDHGDDDGQGPYLLTPYITDAIEDELTVRFDGVRACSCEDDAPCDSKFVNSEWMVYDCIDLSL